MYYLSLSRPFQLGGLASFKFFVASIVDGSWSGLQGKDGNLYKNGAGVNLRPQGYPDAVNHFRSSHWGGVLYPGNVYIHITSYNFGVMKRNLVPNETVS